MTNMSVAGGPRAESARSGLIDRHDLVPAMDRAAAMRVTIISAPAGRGKTSLLRTWAEQPGQDRRIAFMSVEPASTTRAVLAHRAGRDPRRHRRPGSTARPWWRGCCDQACRLHRPRSLRERSRHLP
jgi:hypothetical protein